MADAVDAQYGARRPPPPPTTTAATSSAAHTEAPQDEDAAPDGQELARRAALPLFRDVDAAARLADALAPGSGPDVRTVAADARASALGLRQEPARQRSGAGAVAFDNDAGAAGAAGHPVEPEPSPPPAGGLAGDDEGQWTLVELVSSVVWPAWDSRDAKFTGGRDWVCPPQSQQGW